MSDSKIYNLHCFDGQNYQLWHRQMEIYITENKLRPYILGTVQRPTTDPEKWDEKDEREATNPNNIT